MMETLNTHRPTNRALAVIDGGVANKAGMSAAAPKPKLLDQVRQGDPDAAL
jgi:hypothetical protein